MAEKQTNPAVQMSAWDNSGQKIKTTDTAPQPPQAHIPAHLLLASFVSGAAVMVLELTGTRVIAPFFGTSLIVWTSLIGVIMVSLCLGNRFGGHLADKTPEPRVLSYIFAGAAIIVALTAWGANILLSMLAQSPLIEKGGLYLTSLLAALVIFAPSSLLLGMVSPFLARLALKDISTGGSIVGSLSAFNSLGSIIGTFLGGFVLISLWPSALIMMGTAVILACLAMLVHISVGSFLRAAVIVAAIVWGIWTAVTTGLPATPVGVQIDTAYNHISIVEALVRDDRPANTASESTDELSGTRRVRIMMTDPDGAQSLMYTGSPNELVSDYTKFYDLAFAFNPNVKRILMLGGGGYCVPRHVLNTQTVSMDVVEIDPGITRSAQLYFNLTDELVNGPNLRIFHEDARTFINRGVLADRGPYDAVFMDVFGSWYAIPFQMTTVEAARCIRNLLTPDGILIMNVISSVEGSRSGIFHGIYSAYSTAFPRLSIYTASSAPEPRYAYSLQNLMLVAFANESMATTLSPDAVTPEMARLLSHKWQEPFKPLVPAFTDAFAPVERYALAMNS